MKILDRLPFADRRHLVTVRGEAVSVYRNQIIVWISIDDLLRPDGPKLVRERASVASIGAARSIGSDGSSGGPRP
jgi:hypothetical protein